MKRVGIEIGPDTLRAVALPRWRSKPIRTLELTWDPARPGEFVRVLAAELGPAQRIGLAVGLGLLHVKNVKLPPAQPALKRRMLALEPDRFFAVADEAVAVAITDTSNLAFAVPTGLVDQWLNAFGSWAEVVSIEPAPVALARALAPADTGTFAVQAAGDETGLIEVENGALVGARRISIRDDPPSVVPLPARYDVAPEFLTAFAAARNPASALHTMLLSEPLAERFRGARLRRVALLATICLLSFAFSLWSADNMRSRKLAAIQHAADGLEERATPALQLQSALSGLDRETVTLHEMRSSRPDPLAVLASLSRHLPADAVVLSLRANGDQWQIDGTARNAAAIIPVLDRQQQFANVRFLSASSRFREENRTYETFSIAFNVR